MVIGCALLDWGCIDISVGTGCERKLWWKRSLILRMERGGITGLRTEWFKVGLALQAEQWIQLWNNRCQKTMGILWTFIYADFYIEGAWTPAIMWPKNYQSIVLYTLSDCLEASPSTDVTLKERGFYGKWEIYTNVLLPRGVRWEFKNVNKKSSRIWRTRLKFYGV